MVDNNVASCTIEFARRERCIVNGPVSDIGAFISVENNFFFLIKKKCSQSEGHILVSSITEVNMSIKCFILKFNSQNCDSRCRSS